MSHRTHLASFASALAVLSLATGCATKFNGVEQALTIEQDHPITVDAQVVTMSIKSDGALSDIDRARLRAFAGAYQNNGHGTITVTTASSGPAPKVDAIRETLHAAGIEHGAMGEASYRPGDQANDIILSYTHYVATPSACGVWAGLDDRRYRNMRSPNFGCAAQNNLAAMIGDPRDLVVPADMTSADSQSRILGVEKYREGTVTASDTDNEIETQVAN